MKVVLIILINIFISILLYANKNIIGFKNTILLNKEEQIFQDRIIKIDKEKIIYCTGFINSVSSLDTFILQPQNNNFKSICNVQLDSFKNVIKFFKIAEGPNISFFNFDIDSSSNLYYSITFSDSIIVSNNIFYSKGGTDIVLVKFCNQTLCKSIQIGGIYDEGIAQDALLVDKSENSIYIAGGYNLGATSNNLTSEIIIGIDTLKAKSGERFFLKVDSSLNPIWAKSNYGGNNLRFYENSIYLLGSSRTLDTICGLPIYYPPAYITRFYVAKINKSGEGVWIKKIGQGQIDGLSQFKDLIISNSNVYIAGEGSSNIETKFIFEGGTNLTGNASRDFFIACYDTTGNFKWNTISNSPGDEGLNSLYADSIGNLYGVGNFNQKMYFGSDSLSTKGNQSLFVCSFDSVGKYQFSIAAGGADIDYGSAIAADNNGKIYIVGGVTSPECYFGNDTLHPPLGQSTMFVTTLDSVDINQFPDAVSMENEYQFSIYPNPAKNKLIITSEREQDISVEIVNTLNQIVLAKNNYLAHNKFEIDISTLQSGLYFVILSSHNNRITRKVLIQK